MMDVMRTILEKKNPKTKKDKKKKAKKDSTKETSVVHKCNEEKG